MVQSPWRMTIQEILVAAFSGNNTDTNTQVSLFKLKEFSDVAFGGGKVPPMNGPVAAKRGWI
jgi:hypothetical protein